MMAGLFAAVLGAGLLFVPQARADNIQLVCTGSTVCLPGGIQSTSSTQPTFNVSTPGKSSASGTLFLVIATPNSTLPSGFTVNGVGVTDGPHLWTTGSSVWDATVLNETGTDKNFSSYAGFFQGATGTHSGPMSFTAYDFNLGTYTSPEAIILGGAVPPGTAFIAFLEPGKNSHITETANSESLIVGGHQVPEPSALFLTGTGLTLLGMMRGRRKEA